MHVAGRRGGMKRRKSHFLMFVILALFVLTQGMVAHAREETAPHDDPAFRHAEGLQPEDGEDKILDAGVEFDFNSRYVWRGLYLSQGAVWQPSAWISKWGFTPSVWGNFVLNNEINQGEFNEVDLTLTYAYETHGFTVEPGFIYYLFPNTGVASTGEVSLTLAYQVYGPLSVFTSHYVDVKAFKGGYYGLFGIGIDQGIGKLFTFSSSVSTSWGSGDYNRGYFGVPEMTVDVLAIDIGLNCKPHPNVYVRPHFRYSVLLDSDIRDATGEPNLFRVGVAVGYEY